MSYTRRRTTGSSIKSEKICVLRRRGFEGVRSAPTSAAGSWKRGLLRYSCKPSQQPLQYLSHIFRSTRNVGAGSIFQDQSDRTNTWQKTLPSPTRTSKNNLHILQDSASERLYDNGMSF